MTTNPTISPEAFMAQPPDVDEAELVEIGFGPDRLYQIPENPLDSIAESLRTLVGIAQADVEEERTSDALRERYDDLDAKAAQMYALVEEIEAIVKPSTSKLADSVRAAIGRWKAPQVVPEPEAQVEPEAGHPSHDAPVEEWRAFAISEGLPADDVAGLNRSQLRTALGIPQPGTPVAPTVVHS